MRRLVPPLALAMALGLAGCSTTAPSDYQDIPIDTSAAHDAAALGAGDVFQVRVHGHDDLTGIHRVSPDGTIDFPLVGRVEVAGKNQGQVADLIRVRLLDGFLRRPSVTVYIKEFNSKKVYVLGQVKKPGMFNFVENMSIVQAIALAGGFTGLARTNYAIVRRTEDGVERRIPIPVEQIMTEQGRDFILQPGDVVFVPETVM